MDLLRGCGEVGVDPAVCVQVSVIVKGSVRVDILNCSREKNKEECSRAKGKHVRGKRVKLVE